MVRVWFETGGFRARKTNKKSADNITIGFTFLVNRVELRFFHQRLAKSEKWMSTTENENSKQIDRYIERAVHGRHTDRTVSNSHVTYWSGSKQQNDNSRFCKSVNILG